MVAAIYQGFIKDEAGNIIEGASVEVRDQDTNALVDLWSNRATTSTKTNPTTTDANGYYFFYRTAGRYKITVTSASYSAVFNNVPIGTAQEYDTGSTTGLIPTVDDLATVAITGDYDDLINKPTLGTIVTYNYGTAGGEIQTNSLNDARFFRISNNLSEGTASAMRANIQLGSGDDVTFNTVTASNLQYRATISCIPRNTSGTWALLDDASHEPRGFASVSQPDSTTVRVTYSETAAKINSFIAAADDALAPHGVIFGGDVGTTFANIKGFAPLTGVLSHTSGTPSFTTTALWTPEVGTNIAVTKPDDATINIAHPTSVSGDMPVVTLENASLISEVFPVVESVSASDFDVVMMGPAKGYVAYGGSSWSQSISNNIAAPTLAWQGTPDFAIRVTHPPTTDNALPIVTQFGPYIPRVSNIGAGFFDVQFYDYSGTHITTEDTDMAFIYTRHVLVKCDWPSGVKVTVRRGPCVITHDSYGGVSGNNIWVIAQMDY